MGTSARRLLLVCFLLSGLASLIDQVVWLRYLSLSFGNTTFAAAALLAVFMGGLGAGALLGGRWARALERPLVAYALIEIVIAVIAILSPDGLGLIDVGYVWLYRSIGNAPLVFAVARIVWAALFLLPPTMLMGATLPLVLRAAARDAGQAGRVSGLFYGVNTIGATLGTGLAGFVTIRLIGLHGSLVIAAAANLLAAILALALSRPVEPGQSRSARPEAPRWFLLAVAAMGATSLGYEVLWTRILVFYLGSSVYAYSLVLLSMLVGIGLGSLIATPWADRSREPLQILGWLELGIAASIPVQILLFQYLIDATVAVAGAIGAQSFLAASTAQLITVGALLLVPTVLMGISFPLSLLAVNRTADDLPFDVGRVYGVNTVGAVAGALGTGFVLIPIVGTQGSMLALAIANVAIAAGLFARSKRRPAMVFGLGVVPAAILLAAWLVPPNTVIFSAGIFRYDQPDDLLYFHEDAQASVTVRNRRTPSGPYRSLELNGVNVAGTSPDLYAIQKLQGHLPLLLAPSPRRAVHIGFGSGGTAWAVSRHPMEEIRIVEISPEVLAASDRFFRDINHGVLDDPRVRTEINDGRNFLLASPERFDAVLSDSIHPRYAGNGSLYSEEYFALAAERLESDGVISMWLPMYSLTPRNFAMILRAFHASFPEMAVWYEASSLNSFTIVTGSKSGRTWDVETIERAFSEGGIRDELVDIGISGPEDLLPLLMATQDDLAPWLATVPSHVDDLPSVEYESGTLLHRDATWIAIFDTLLELRPEEPPAAYVDGLPEPVRAEAVARYRARRDLLEDHRHQLAIEIGQDLGVATSSER